MPYGYSPTDDRKGTLSEAVACSIELCEATHSLPKGGRGEGGKLVAGHIQHFQTAMEEERQL